MEFKKYLLFLSVLLFVGVVFAATSLNVNQVNSVSYTGSMLRDGNNGAIYFYGTNSSGDVLYGSLVENNGSRTYTSLFSGSGSLYAIFSSHASSSQTYTNGTLSIIYNTSLSKSLQIPINITIPAGGSSVNLYFSIDGRAFNDSSLTQAFSNSAPIFSSISNKSVNENSTLQFNVSANDSDGDSISFSASNLPTGSSFNSSGFFSWTPNFTQSGFYQINFTANDSFSTSSTLVNVTVVNTNVAPILTTVGNKSVNENSSLQFTLNASDFDTDVLSFSAIGLPIGASLNSSSGVFVWTPNFTQAGNYTVVFIVSDGNLTDNESIIIQVNNTNRNPVLSQIGNKSTNENSTLQFTLNATDVDGDVLIFSSSSLPIGSVLNSTSGFFNWTPNFTQAGNYTVVFIVSDSSLSVNESIVIQVNNTNRSPILSQIGNKSVLENSTLQFTINGSDPDGDSITFSLIGLPNGALFNLTSELFNWTPNFTQSGNYSVVFIVSDFTLSSNETIIIQVNNTNRQPILNTVGNKSTNENSTLQFTLNGSDPDGDNISFSSVSLPSGTFLNSSSGLFNWTPNFTQSGNYSITFIVSDGNLTSNETVNIQVNNSNRAPVLSTVGNKSVAENSSLQFNLTASDPDGDSIVFLISTLPFGASFNTSSGQFIWTPNFTQAGNYSIIFFVNDSFLLSNESILIQVNNTNRAPVLNSIGNKSVNETLLLTFNLSASDADNDSFVFSSLGLPNGASVNNTTGQFSWTPNSSQAGIYNITFVVSDSLLSSNETIFILVNNTNVAPVLSTVGNKTVNVTQQLTFTLNATDIDNDTVIFSVLNIPIGAVLNSSSGIFNWTPNSSQAGIYNLTFVVSDSLLNATQNITITVFDNIAPSISIINFPNSSTTGEIAYISITASDNILGILNATIIINGNNFSMPNNGNNGFNYTINISSNSTASVKYNVTVYDLSGNSNVTITQTLVVVDNDAPIADFSFVSAIEGFSSQFISNSTDNIGVVSYFWLFGDGFNSSLSNVNHTYNISGVYLVELNVTDLAGNSALKQLNITITDSTPVPDFVSNTPIITIQSPTNSTYFTNHIDLNYTSTDISNVSSCSYTIDNSSLVSLVNCSNTTLFGLSQGIHNLSLISNDTFNNTNSSSILFLVNLSGTINGYILNSSNIGIVNTTVQAKQGSSSINSTLTALDGSFVLSLPNGTYDVVISKSGYVQNIQQGVVVNSISPTILSNITLQLSVSKLVGYVVDSNGSSIANTSVVLGNISNLTDSNGYYSIDASLGIYNVTANKTGYFDQTITGVILYPGVNVLLNITLTSIGNYSNATSTVNGTVSDLFNNLLNSNVSFVGSQFFNTTSSAGFYNMSLNGGVYNTSAYNFCYINQSISNVLVKANQINTRNFVLYPISSNFFVHLNDSFDGSNVSGANIFINYNNSAVSSASSDANGSVNLGLFGGIYNISISKSGYVLYNQNISLLCGNSSQNISLVPLGNVLGNITNGAFSIIELKQGGVTIYNTTADSSGFYSLTAAVGTYQLIITKSGFNIYTENIIITKTPLTKSPSLTQTSSGGSGSSGGGGGSSLYSGGITKVNNTTQSSNATFFNQSIQQNVTSNEGKKISDGSGSNSGGSSGSSNNSLPEGSAITGAVTSNTEFLLIGAVAIILIIVGSLVYFLVIRP
ncbi:MAG: tandem-95 repeat protein [Candidatus Aenigmarchaeota archaeon]|nr:tandem-95 repeat protein [Candidatus Aenigmarchaeota archaeon]